MFLTYAKGFMVETLLKANGMQLDQGKKYGKIIKILEDHGSTMPGNSVFDGFLHFHGQPIKVINLLGLF